MDPEGPEVALKDRAKRVSDECRARKSREDDVSEKRQRSEEENCKIILLSKNLKEIAETIAIYEASGRLHVPEEHLLGRDNNSQDHSESLFQIAKSIEFLVENE